MRVHKHAQSSSSIVKFVELFTGVSRTPLRGRLFSKVSRVPVLLSSLSINSCYSPTRFNRASFYPGRNFSARHRRNTSSRSEGTPGLLPSPWLVLQRSRYLVVISHGTITKTLFRSLESRRGTPGALTISAFLKRVAPRTDSN